MLVWGFWRNFEEMQSFIGAELCSVCAAGGKLLVVYFLAAYNLLKFDFKFVILLSAAFKSW